MLKVLVVDDEEIRRGVISNTIDEIRGMNAEGAEDEQDAYLKLIKATLNEPFGLIIVDQDTDSGALKFIELIRTTEGEIKNIPIIVVVSHSEKKPGKYKEAGANDYITEPFGSEEIKEKIKKLLKKATYEN